MNIFELAEKQIIREKKTVSISKVLERAITIRKWLDKNQATAKQILKGKKFYRRSDGRIKISSRYLETDTTTFYSFIRR